MKNFFSVIAAGVVAVSATMAAPRAEAANVGFELLVTAAPGGLFAGETSINGGVVFDDTLVPTTPGSFVELSKTGVAGTTQDLSIGLYFDAGPYTFTEADAVSDPVFTFSSGLLRSINYIVTFGSSSNDLVAFGVEQFSFDINTPITFDGDTYGVNAFVKPLPQVSAVPLPAGLPLLAGGLGLLALMRRRRAA